MRRLFCAISLIGDLYVMPRFIHVISRLALLVPLYALAQQQPSLSGFVTDPGSPETFTMNSIPVRCTSATEYVMVNAAGSGNSIGNGNNRDASKSIGVMSCPQHFLGESVTVFGTFEKDTNTLTATRVEQKNFVGSSVIGFAVVDKMLSIDRPSDRAEELIVRADGYRIVLAKTTKNIFNPPMTGLGEVQTNIWIRYSGQLQADGTILAEEAAFSKNDIASEEERLRNKNEFDPSLVDEDDRQRHIGKAIHGLDVHRIPAYHDDAIQQRVEALGTRLIPAFQRMLSNDDPTKINFRFQLVDQKRLRDGLALPSGIILVPYQVVQRLQNDTQLATVLADGIATAMEKEGLRELPTKERMKALQIAGTAGGFFVPGLGFITGFANHAVKNNMDRHAEVQSGRVSLGLLYDAGFDITQAPVAWWLLASTKPKDLKDIKMPFRTSALYGVLGTTWRQQVTSSR
jgi:hypothetical protein